MFKERIKERRAAMGLSQSQLALRLGVTAPCIAGWESGRTVPKTDMLVKLADVLGCTIDYLMGREVDTSA